MVEQPTDQAQQAGRHLLLTAGQRASPLDHQERVALGGLDGAAELGLRQGADPLADGRQVAVAERRQSELRAHQASTTQRLDEGVQGRPARVGAPGEEDQDGPVGQPPTHVAQEVEARDVGGVGVVDDEQHRRAAGPADQRHHRLEEPDPFEVGGSTQGRTGDRAELALDARSQRPEDLWPPAPAGGASTASARVPPARPTGPAGQCPEVEAGARGHQTALGAHPRHQLLRQPRLADPGSPLTTATDIPSPRSRPELAEVVQLTLATHHRGRRGARSGRARRPAAERVGEASGLWRHLEVELGAQPAFERDERLDRTRPVAGLVQPGHQPSDRHLVVGVGDALPPRPPDRLVEVPAVQRRPGQRLEHRQAAQAPPLTLLDDPLVVEAGHQLAVPGHRLVELALLDQGVHPCGVELDLRAGTHAHDVPVEDEGEIGFVTQRLAQRPQCAPQAGPRAAVEDVGPEHRRHDRARMNARVQQQPRQQGPGAPTGRGLDRGAVDLDGTSPRSRMLSTRHDTAAGLGCVQNFDVHRSPGDASFDGSMTLVGAPSEPITSHRGAGAPRSIDMTIEITLDTDRLDAFMGQFVDRPRRRHARAARRHRRQARPLQERWPQPGPARRPQLAAGAPAPHERYVREWLDAQAAGGYVTYDADDEHATRCRPSRRSRSPTRTARRSCPARSSSRRRSSRDEPHDRRGASAPATASAGTSTTHDLFHGTERFFRPGYLAQPRRRRGSRRSTASTAKLERGARVADVGCGHGASTILMAQAFPSSTFVGFDYHAGVDRAARRRAPRRRRRRPRRASRSRRPTTTPARGYDLVAFFDCLHDMGDPVGAARARAARRSPPTARG